MKVSISYLGADFVIDVNESTYDLVRLGQNLTEDSKNYLEITEKPLGYFTNLGSCIEKIFKSSMSTTEETVDLKGLVERFEDCKKELLGLIH